MGAVENIKEVAELIKKYNNLELNRKIVALEDEVLELTRDKRRLENRMEEQERALKFQGELTFREPFYFLPGDKTPYCAACWESKRLAVHVADSWDPVRYNHRECPTCHHHYAIRPGPM